MPEGGNNFGFVRMKSHTKIRLQMSWYRHGYDSMREILLSNKFLQVFQRLSFIMLKVIKCKNNGNAWYFIQKKLNFKNLLHCLPLQNCQKTQKAIYSPLSPHTCLSHSNCYSRSICQTNTQNFIISQFILILFRLTSFLLYLF